MVDKGSAHGWIQVSGAGKTITRINTGLVIVHGDRNMYQEQDYAIVEILEGQSCMLYACPTVLYIRPKT